MPRGTIQQNELYGKMILAEDSRWFFLPDESQSLAFDTSVTFEEYVHPRLAPPPGIHRAIHVVPEPVSPPPRSWTSVAAQLPSRVVSTARREPTRQERVDELRAGIIAQKETLRATAEKHLKENPGRADRTVCFMWKVGFEKPKMALSGQFHLTRSERETIGAAVEKETSCAEEVFLSKFGTSDWVFSLSYDSTNGFKRACRAGCSDLLFRLRITDLADAVGR